MATTNLNDSTVIANLHEYKQNIIFQWPQQFQDKLKFYCTKLQGYCGTNQEVVRPINQDCLLIYNVASIPLSKTGSKYLIHL